MPITIEKYPAVVADNKDPDKRGRIQVKCSAILGDEETKLPMWLEPCFDWGWFYIPDVGEIVEIEVKTNAEQDESFGQSSINCLDAKWCGKRYYGNEEGDAPTPIHDDFKTNYGKRRGFATPLGHIFVFDDTDGKASISLTWTDGDKKSVMLFDTDGTIKLTNKDDQFIHLKDGECVVSLGGGTDVLTLKDSEVNIKLASGDGIKITGAGVGAAAVIGDGAVKAAIANHLETFYTSMVKTTIETWAGLLNGHVHPDAFGGTGPFPCPLVMPTWTPNINSGRLKFPDGV